MRSLPILAVVLFILAQCAVDARKLEPIKKVDIKGGVVRVNGKPFFPLEITFAAHGHNGLKVCGEAGFNCVQTFTYDIKDPLSFRRDIRDAYANGMYAIVSFNSLQDDLEMIKKVVRACKNEPGLLAWELPDEPNIRPAEPADRSYPERAFRFPPSQLRAMYDAIKAIDTNHPVYVNLCYGFASDHMAYNLVADVMAGDVYPVPGVALEEQAAYCDATVQGCAGKPAWQYVQMCPVRPHLKDQDRAPTIEEVRCLSYMCIAHGITGLQYFAYNMRPGIDFRPDVTHPDYWAKWPGLLAELKSLSPFFLEPDAGKVDVKQSEGPGKGPRGYQPLHVSLRKHGNEYLLIAVNGAYENVTAKLTLPVAVSKSGSVISESREIEMGEGNTLEDKWGPAAVHLYKFKAR